MKILVIDPVVLPSFQAMSQQYLQAQKLPGTQLDVIGLTKGPRSVETYYDEYYAAPEILRIVAERWRDYDAIMINCFADVALPACRELADIPVVGPGEASMFVAATLGTRFSIVSIGRNAGPKIRLRAEASGISAKISSIYGIDLGVVELDNDPSLTEKLIVHSSRKAIEQDGAEVILLGCTGMAPVARAVAEELKVPVVEPSATALRVAESLVSLGLKHSRKALYGRPNLQGIIGYGEGKS